jgi:hypothetical protein
MTLSNAEKVRRYRERQKAKKQQELKQPSLRGDLFRTPFFEFFSVDEQLGSQYVQSLELAGVQPLIFNDDTGPETSTLDDLRDDFEEDGFSNPFGDSKGTSLGKAEVLVSCLLDSASDLAFQINAYKKSELNKRMSEIENSDLADPETKKAAFAKMGELNVMLEELKKEIRWPIPIWTTGMNSAS